MASSSQGWTNPQLRRLAEVVLEAPAEDPLRGAAPRIAKMCRWRGRYLAELGKRLEEVERELTTAA